MITTPRPTMREIQSAVARHYGLYPEDLTSPARAQHISHPRQLAMYLGRTMAARSLAEIGRDLGGRDHSTIHFGVRQVEKRLKRSHLQLVVVRRIRRRVREMVKRRVAVWEAMAR